MSSDARHHEQPPFPTQELPLPAGPIAQVQSVFPTAVPAAGMPECPEHHKPYRSNSRGFYCPTKVGEDASGKSLWCQRRP